MDTPEMPRSTLGHGFRAGILSAVALVSFCCAMPFVSSDVAAEPAPEATSSEQSVERSRPKPSARPKASKPSDPDELAFKAAVAALLQRQMPSSAASKPGVAQKLQSEEPRIKQFVFKKHFAKYRAECGKGPANCLNAMDIADLASSGATKSSVSKNLEDILGHVKRDIDGLLTHAAQAVPAATTAYGPIVAAPPKPVPSPAPTSAVPAAPSIFDAARASAVSSIPGSAPLRQRAALAVPTDPDHLAAGERIVRANLAKLDQKNFFKQIAVAMKHTMLAVAPQCEVFAERIVRDLIAVAEPRFGDVTKITAKAWTSYFSKGELVRLAPLIESGEALQPAFRSTELGQKMFQVAPLLQRDTTELGRAWGQSLIQHIDVKRVVDELGPDLANCFPPPAPATRN